jgi:ankyrin repeat protein
MLSETTKNWMREHGFEPSQLDGKAKHRDTALILASRLGEEAIVEELLDAGAAVNLTNSDGTNALWAACVANSYPIAEKLIAHGADIDNQNENGATVLMYAASSNRDEWVDYLLQKGADTSLRSPDDFSALDLASNITILRRLRAAEKGAELTQSAGG